MYHLSFLSGINKGFSVLFIILSNRSQTQFLVYRLHISTVSLAFVVLVVFGIPVPVNPLRVRPRPVAPPPGVSCSLCRTVRRSVNQIRMKLQPLGRTAALQGSLETNEPRKSQTAVSSCFHVSLQDPERRAQRTRRDSARYIPPSFGPSCRWMTLTHIFLLVFCADGSGKTGPFSEVMMPLSSLFIRLEPKKQPAALCSNFILSYFTSVNKERKSRCDQTDTAQM